MEVACCTWRLGATPEAWRYFCCSREQTQTTAQEQEPLRSWSQLWKVGGTWSSCFWSMARMSTPILQDRKSVASGKSVSILVDLVGLSPMKKKTQTEKKKSP